MRALSRELMAKAKGEQNEVATGARQQQSESARSTLSSRKALDGEKRNIQFSINFSFFPFFYGLRSSLENA